MTYDPDRVSDPALEYGPDYPDSEPCLSCGGEGYFRCPTCGHREECEDCGGTGEGPQPEREYEPDQEAD
jgi:DnaJ-class molecular chaperone